MFDDPKQPIDQGQTEEEDKGQTSGELGGESYAEEDITGDLGEVEEDDMEDTEMGEDTTTTE